MKLYSYFRSSAAFRVRIALNLKGISYETVAINIKPGDDEQFSSDYKTLNPQGRVPFLVDGDVQLSQSTAIIEYIDEAYPNSSVQGQSGDSLLPDKLKTRAKVRQIVNLIACDIHPLNNLSVLQKLKGDYSATDEDTAAWYQHWIAEGFSALEQVLVDNSDNSYCVTSTPSMADVYLVPQVWNALRFNVDMTQYPQISSIYKRCIELPAFFDASPEQQMDNPEYKS